MPTAQEIYASAIRDLPPEEQLRLAALILNRLTRTVEGEANTNDSWSDEDMHDVAAFSMKHADSLYSEGEDLV
jgi:hypothetical protein